MDFNIVGFSFWMLVCVASILLIYGLWKGSSKLLIISSIAFLLPTLYFIGAENWFKFLVLIPLFPLIIAYFTNKNVKNT
ncbi:hypothetical protein OBCHQ24_06145 [Oceanobacillus iheyensis]|nr:hypothetical protein OBCHQ24_06145 [Oceanobacillus iheyensis]